MSSYARLRAAAKAIQRRASRPPAVALVLGSGLGAFAETLNERTVMPYSEIEAMPVSRVVGHSGQLVFGQTDSGMAVAVMQGRVHLYEGHAAQDVVFGVRLLSLLGARTLLVTNAAGGVSQKLEAGDLMVIDDHLNLTGQNCLTGPNEDELGPRFPDMSEAYDRGLRKAADAVAAELGFELAHGVYAGLLGPSYETPAEIRMLERLGADAVGMSTVLETIAARHAGMRVLGISCITNLAAGRAREPLSHDEVQETANRVSTRFQALIGGVLGKIAQEPG